jgi:hypothetical protein
MTARPPAYPSKAALAAELDCAESTVDDLVKSGHPAAAHQVIHRMRALVLGRR